MYSKSISESSTDLVLTELPNGEFAWLRPETDRSYHLPSRYWITDTGRRALAEDALFGRPWPTVAETIAS